MATKSGIILFVALTPTPSHLITSEATADTAASGRVKEIGIHSSRQPYKYPMVSQPGRTHNCLIRLRESHLVFTTTFLYKGGRQGKTVSERREAGK